ncbi:Putative splicing factor 3B, subunit 3, SF3B3 [Chondrus crispus]|uniref:Putative splicing factor 3B, subunit 3, SF3B3 n=1 Tax=Chondrus crispus TaxID=2769 RepID=R7Q6T1_CHOCR|nr:Putative splicing factor 3B, subunit 3, SF3B3 [Chondrus crispus]CDF33081.1 Putative splicing factor 3B, subunit 3, SF3B3 [Chondrus crispus]|eukprot:XP_005712884.1 Putative splicing factor 3B, subunit 3, SF3B3 [Chondrus crispus]
MKQGRKFPENRKVQQGGSNPFRRATFFILSSSSPSAVLTRIVSLLPPSLPPFPSRSPVARPAPQPPRLFTMHLYHFTALCSSTPVHLANGSFTLPRQQELVLARAGSLHLYRLHPKTSYLQPLFQTPVFCQIRSLSTFRLPGTRRDYLLLTTDAGAVTILSASAMAFRRVHCEPFGKSGARRTVPAEYAVCEPHGRAAMLAALEKGKLAYVLNRDPDENLTISSPLEAHKSALITHALTSLDVGFDNPVFAALERTYDATSYKVLAYYELDLGLNQVVRKRTARVAAGSNLLLTVPGGTDGPGGVLVCSPGIVAYRNLLDEDDEGRLIALMEDPPDGAQPENECKEPLVVAGTAYHDRKRNAFFFLLSTELGDLIKAELAWEPDRGATKLSLFYFDTLPGPALGMCIFRSGYLAAAIEGSDALLLRFKEVNVPEDNPAGGFSSSTGATLAGKLQFRPSALLCRLTVAEVIDSFGPILGMCKLDGGGVGQSSSLVCTTGKARGGCVRVIRRGMGVLEMSQPNELRAKVTEVFSCKENAESLYHRLIVVSFAKKTKVLEVGDAKLEETVNSGFELNERTLAAGQIGTNSFVQVTRSGVRFVRGGDAKSASEWIPPVPAVVLAGCCNQQQVVVVLSTGAIVNFEVDSKIDWAGSEADEIGAPVIAIPDVPPGRKRSKFFAAGDGVSVKVRIFQILEDGSIEALGLHLAPAPVESIALIDFACIDKEAIISSPFLALVIGTIHGALVRLTVDALTGTLSSKQSHFLGEKPVRVKHVKISGVPTCLLMGSSTWLLFLRGGRATMSPLSTDPMDRAAAFALEQSPDGFAVTYGSRLRLLSLESVSALITSACLPHGLSSTPRKVVRIPRIRKNVSLNAIDDCLPDSSMLDEIVEPRLHSLNGEDDPDLEGTNPYSSVRPSAFETLDTVKMDEADCILTVASFLDFGGDTTGTNRYLVVSVASNMQVSGTAPKLPKRPRSPLDERSSKREETFVLRVYQVDAATERLTFVHKTVVPEAVYCLTAFRDMLLVGIGATLRLYDLGKQQLLRKGEYKLAVRNKISALAISGGDRIFVGDVSDSVTLFKYEPSEPIAANHTRGAAIGRRGGHFVPLAADTVPRWIVTLEVLDYNTVSAGDKFGNIFVLRVPTELGILNGGLSITSASPVDRGRAAINIAPHKLVVEASYHVGSMTGSLVRGSLALQTTKLEKNAGDEALIYSTLSGTIGILAPLRTQHDIDFARALEREMRTRGKHVVDGDLCQAFTGLSPTGREECATALGRSVEDIDKKLEELQSSYV